ncbi:glycosyltransferase family 39 protein, partial [bacterium]|nr:glycosyltransferase family 39 protein [bacterium]
LKIHDPSFYLPPQGTDMLTYHNIACQILNGSLGKEPYYYGPLYFYFLALVYKIFGIDPYITRLIQMLLGVATSGLIYLIARKVFNKTVAFISISISILYGMFYIHEGVLLMESLVTFLNTLFIFLLLRIEDKPSYKNIAFAGIAIGLSALARANILLFVPFILIWMFSAFSFQLSVLKKFGFLCLVILLTISPATIRNYLTSGKFVLISTNGPVNLWIGNNPYAEGDFQYPPSSYQKKVSEQIAKKGDIAYIKEVFRFIKEEPMGYLRLLFEKLLLFWGKGEVENNINTTSQKGYSALLGIPIFVDFGLIASLSLLGIAISLRYWRRYLLLYLFIFSFMISTILFFVLSRYRVAFIPVLLPFVGFTLYWWYEKIKTKSFQSLLLSLIALIFSVSLTHSATIKGILYPHIFPEGLQSKGKNGVIIRDHKDVSDEDVHWLQLPFFSMIKKELVIKESPSNYSRAFLYIKFIPTSDSKLLTVDINNNKKVEVSLESYREKWLSEITLDFNPNLFHKGTNSFVLSVKDSSLSIPVCYSYTFRRSYFWNKESKWEQLKKGEYMVSLELSR